METKEPMYICINDSGVDMINNLPGLHFESEHIFGGGGFLMTASGLLEDIIKFNLRIVYEIPENLKDEKNYRVPTSTEITLLETLMLNGTPSPRDYFALREKIYGNTPTTAGQAFFKLHDLLRL